MMMSLLVGYLEGVGLEPYVSNVMLDMLLPEGKKTSMFFFKFRQSS